MNDKKLRDKIFLSIFLLLVGVFITNVVYENFFGCPLTPVFEDMGIETDVDGNYEIRWQETEKADSYILEEDKNPSFTNPKKVYQGSEIKADIYGKSNGDYYYRLRACNKASESDWSSPRKVTVYIPTPTIPTPTTSTPTPTPTTPPKLIQINITNPTKGDRIPVSNVVSGTISGELQQGQNMWVVINPSTSPGQWWPEGGRIVPWEGQWKIQAWIGENGDIGKEFDIAVILVNEKDNQYYNNYLETGQKTGSYPGVPLPPSAKIMDKITVVRI